MIGKNFMACVLLGGLLLQSPTSSAMDPASIREAASIAEGLALTELTTAGLALFGLSAALVAYAVVHNCTDDRDEAGDRRAEERIRAPKQKTKQERLMERQRLGEAVRRGDVKTVKAILEQGTFDLKSFLQIALTKKNEQMIKLLLDKGAGSAGVIYYAAEHGYSDLLSVLLEAGENPNCSDCDGCTPLYRLVQACVEKKEVTRGHAQCFAKLIEYGANELGLGKAQKTIIPFLRHRPLTAEKLCICIPMDRREALECKIMDYNPLFGR